MKCPFIIKPEYIALCEVKQETLGCALLSDDGQDCHCDHEDDGVRCPTFVEMAQSDDDYEEIEGITPRSVTIDWRFGHPNRSGGMITLLYEMM